MYAISTKIKVLNKNLLCKLLNDIVCFVSIEPVLQYYDHITHQPMRADISIVTSLGTYYIDISVVVINILLFVNLLYFN